MSASPSDDTGFAADGDFVDGVPRHAARCAIAKDEHPGAAIAIRRRHRPLVRSSDR
jgi:hypothetical protein